MNIENKKKVFLNRLSIIVGTKCNLNCKHCLGGEPDRNLKITDEVVSNLLDNLTGINELTFAGYEISLNIDEVRMILNMIISRKIKVNYLTFITNCVSFNEELAHLFNDFRFNHTTFPDEAVFQISFDEFHFNNGFTREKLQENFHLYSNIIDECEYSINDLSEGLFIEGRAKKLSPLELDKFPKIIIPLHQKNFLEFRRRCEGDRNTCNNGKCVCNCVANIVILTPNGDIYANMGEAFDALNNRLNKYAIGNVNVCSLYDMFQTSSDNNLDTSSGRNLIFRDYNSFSWNANFLLYKYLKSRKYLLLALKYGNNKIYCLNRKIILDTIKNVNSRVSTIEDDSEKQVYLFVLNEIYNDYTKFEKLNNFCKSAGNKSKTTEYINKELGKFLFNEENFKNFFGFEYKLFEELWDSYTRYDFEKFQIIGTKIYNIKDYEPF